jgi:hypothetical protein
VEEGDVSENSKGPWPDIVQKRRERNANKLYSLAMAEMKTLLRDLYSRYETEPDISMKIESMKMDDQLISSRPLGKQCLLKFVPVKD